MKSEMTEVTAEQRDALFKFAFEKRAQATGRSAALNGAGWGALAGAGLGLLNHYSTPKDEDEPELKRLLLHILGGATLGGVAGAGLNYLGVPKAVANAATQAVAIDPPPAKPVDNRPKEQIYQEKANSLWDRYAVGTRGKRGLIGAMSGPALYEGTAEALNLLGNGFFWSRGGKILTTSGEDLNVLRANPMSTIGTWWRDKSLPELKEAYRQFTNGEGPFRELSRILKSKSDLAKARTGDRNARQAVLNLVKSLDLDGLPKLPHSVKTRFISHPGTNPGWFARKILGKTRTPPTVERRDLVDDAIPILEKAVAAAEKAYTKTGVRANPNKMGRIAQRMRNHRVKGDISSAVLGAVLGAALPVDTQAQTPSADTQDLRD